MKRLGRLRRTDLVLAAAALIATLFFEALLALGIAVVLSLLLLIWRVSRPNVSGSAKRPASLAWWTVWCPISAPRGFPLPRRLMSASLCRL